MLLPLKSVSGYKYLLNQWREKRDTVSRSIPNPLVLTPPSPPHALPAIQKKNPTPTKPLYLKLANSAKHKNKNKYLLYIVSYTFPNPVSIAPLPPSLPPSLHPSHPSLPQPHPANFLPPRRYQTIRSVPSGFKKDSLKTSHSSIIRNLYGLNDLHLKGPPTVIASK